MPAPAPDVERADVGAPALPIPPPTPQLIALGGGGFSTEPEDPRLDAYVLAAARGRAGAVPGAAPRVCFLATAAGDNPAYVARFYAAFGPDGALARAGHACVATHLDLFRPSDWTRDPADVLAEVDVVYGSGGSTRNALVLWQAWGLVPLLRAAYDRGAVFAGPSAGACAWFAWCLSDSVGRAAVPLQGLGWVPGSFCPHYDGEPHRRPAYRAAVAAGALPGGYAADDGAALHFRGGHLWRVVTSRPAARAYRVQRSATGTEGTREVDEHELPWTFLDATGAAMPPPPQERTRLR
jgi:peptidase E